MKRIFMLVLLAASCCLGQTYSRVRQHVREYDDVAETLKDNLEFLPTNTVLYSETDPLFTNWLGTNDYVQTELDPVWGAASNLYATWSTLDTNGYVRVASPSNQAVVMRDGTNWVTTFSVRASEPYATWLSSVYPAGTNLFTEEGQLVSYAGSTYMLRYRVDHSNYYHTHGGLSPAPALVDSSTWLSFAAAGAAGATGAAGADGADGVGGIYFGPWDSGREYLYATDSIPVVSYAGRWYEGLASSTNKEPTSETNYWAVSVTNGVDGVDGADAVLVAFTNLVDRGAWKVDVDNYVTNHFVTYGGNIFVVTSNNPPVASNPAVDANSVGVNNMYWDVLVSRGLRGLAGAAGANGINGVDGAYITNAFYSYILDPSLNLVTNDPVLAGDLIEFSETTGGTNMLRWATPAYLDAAAAGQIATNVALRGESPAYRIVQDGVATVELDATNGWMQTFAPTGNCEITFAEKTSTNNVLNVRLDLDNRVAAELTWVTNAPVVAGIPTVSTTAVMTILFDSRAGEAGFTARELE